MSQLIVYLSLGIGLFVLQNLLLPVTCTRLDFLSLLIFYVGAAHPLGKAVFLAFLLGIVVDSYSLTPLGLQAGLYLLVVILAQFFRRHLNLHLAAPQILATALTLECQGMLHLGILHVLAHVGMINMEAVWFTLERASITALLAPPAFALWRRLDKSLGRYFYSAWSVSPGPKRPSG